MSAEGMGGYQPYPAYKDSGVEWLGKIPARWEARPIFALFQRRTERGHDSEQLLSVYRDYGVVPREGREDNHNRPSQDLSNYQLVKPGDLAINKMKTWQGSLAVSDYRGIVSPAYIICKPVHREHSKWLHYVLRSPPYVTQYGRLSYGVRVAQWDMRFEDFRRVEVLLPPLPEQRAIAAFLDHKTAEIDTLIARKEQLIALLQEKRAALISRVVAGRSEDDEVRLGYYVDLLPGYAFPSQDFTKDPQDLRLLRGNNIAPGTLRWEDNEFWPSRLISGLERYQLEQGDIVFGMDRPWIGAGIRVAQVTEDDLPSLLVQRVARLRAREGLSQEYLLLVLGSPQFRAYFEPILTGISVPHVSGKQILSFRLRLPSVNRQIEACRFLGEEDTEITALEETLIHSILLLQEYRTALISAAVTGKIDVREGTISEG